MGLFFFPFRPPAPLVEKCSFWKRSSHEPSGSSSSSTCCARTASQPSSAPSPSTSSAARPLLSVPLPAASQGLALLGRTLEVARKTSPVHQPLFVVLGCFCFARNSFFPLLSCWVTNPTNSLKSIIFLLWEGKSSSIPGLSCDRMQSLPLNWAMCSSLPRFSVWEYGGNCWCEEPQHHHSQLFPKGFPKSEP